MGRSSQLSSASDSERLSDTIVHVVGVALALFAVPVLISMAISVRGDGASVLAISIYGICLLAMLSCSAIYNIFHGGRWTPVFKRMDHSVIYLKIAGSFTPLVALTGGAGLPFLAGLWGAALGGTSLKILAPDRLRWLGLSLYLGMGWVGVIAGYGVVVSLSPASIWLVSAGGCLYTFGVVFFLWERLPYHTTIWHVFVLVASAMIYAAILLEVIREIDIPLTAL